MVNRIIKRKEIYWSEAKVQVIRERRSLKGRLTSGKSRHMGD